MFAISLNTSYETYITHTNEINRTLNYHVIRLAIRVYFRKAKLATSLISPPLLMLSHYACYEKEQQV